MGLDLKIPKFKFPKFKFKEMENVENINLEKEKEKTDKIKKDKKQYEATTFKTIKEVFKNSMEMVYVLPIKAICISIIFVAIVIGIIMKYSMSKINKQNIIETIRNENI